MLSKSIEKYSNEDIIFSDEKCFCFKGPDGYFTAWLSKDDLFQVCKDRICGGIHILAAFPNDVIIGLYILEKKHTFTPKRLS